ncbi:TPA: GDP-mannose 4,6-dehydratase [Candidatus Dependentiae bacterium]|nr:GDP-mannose 4,6-dehydratase [Candidatus Dependentiae bacterium]HCU00803.1 GDP-mannose 4,6-dehydratase [Candidatus Dependentiae bacterium]
MGFISTQLRFKYWVFKLWFIGIFLLQINGNDKKALIFGITGQDGFYLTKLLLDKNYIVHGCMRNTPSQLERMRQSFKGFYKNSLFLHYGDLTDASSIIELLDEVKPDEIYNLGAQSQVALSFKKAEYTTNCDALGPLRILEAIRILGLKDKIRFYQASSSEMFGDVEDKLQDEMTLFAPKSPYATAKLFAYWITRNYREAYKIFACNGILFNHESERRGRGFVTRKIARAVAKISCGKNKVLCLGNLDSTRDWGYAPDYVEAMWLMLQQNAPDDYVIATGEGHSVREFVEAAFKVIGVTVEWHGDGINEIGRNKETEKILVRIDPKFFRPNDKKSSLGCNEKAKKLLRWQPTTKFNELAKKMVESELLNHL